MSGPVHVEYCCPSCHGELRQQSEAFHCQECGLRFPIVLGIPDFRLQPDPYLDLAADHEKARRLLEQGAGLDFRGLVELYWALTPDTSSEMAQRFTQHALGGRSRGRSWLCSFEPSVEVEGSNLLEIGCRTGGLVAAAAEQKARVVGIDVAFRWLVVARRGLEEVGLEAQLCCCNGEHLPFPESSFDLVLVENVLEHAADAEALLVEGHRALRPRGRLAGTTWNRWAPLPEPHVRLWGVGWMPRSWARRYVPWRDRGNYDHVRLQSPLALRQMLRRSPMRSTGVRAAALLPEQAQWPEWIRGLIRFYERVRRIPVLGWALSWIAPTLEFQGQRPP